MTDKRIQYLKKQKERRKYQEWLNRRPNKWQIISYFKWLNQNPKLAK